MKKKILPLLVIVFFVMFFYFLKKDGSEIVDKQYSFKFSESKDWKRVAPREEAYLSLATLEENTIVSYVDVRPLVTANLPNDTQNALAQLCQDMVREFSGISSVFEPISLSNISGYKCSYEVTSLAEPTVTLISSSYTLFGGEAPQFFYILSSSYPKGNALEEEKVVRLINSFSIL